MTSKRAAPGGVFALLVLAAASRAFSVTPFVHETVLAPKTRTDPRFFASLAMAGNLARISFFDPGRADLEFAARNTTGWIIELVDSTATTGTQNALVLAADGTPHILYFAETAGLVRHAWKPGDAWKFETVEAFSAPVGGNTSLRIDAGDNLHAAYSWGGAGISYAVREAGGWRIETVTRTGSSPSLGLDTSGSPVVSYVEPTGLRYATRSGGAWRSESIENTGTGGSPFAPSLALDAQDVPHVAYAISRPNQAIDLAYAVRGGNGWNSEQVTAKYDGEHALIIDATGTPRIGFSRTVAPAPELGGLVDASRTGAGWVFAPVDPSSGVGRWPSIALDAHGEPCLSYSNGFSLTLYFASAAPLRFEPLGAFQLWSSPYALAVPGIQQPHLSDLFGRVLGPMGEFTWKGFSLEGSNLRLDPVFDTGRGYWINTLTSLPKGFELAGDIASIPAVTLAAGWNILGAPSTSPLGARVCIRAHDRFFSVPEAVDSALVAPVVFDYVDTSSDLVNNGEFLPTDLLQAALVFRPDHGTLLLAFEPIEFQFDCNTAAPTGPIATGRATSDSPLDWSLNLSARSGGKWDRGVQVGVAPGALATRDRLDWPRPPQPGSALVVAVEHRDWGRFAAAYLRDVQSTQQDTYRWPIVVSGAGPQLELSASGFESLPPGWQVFLVLPGGAAVRLDSQSTFTTPGQAGRYNVDLVVTRQPWTGPLVRSGFNGILTAARSARDTVGHVLAYQIVDSQPASLRIFDAKGRIVRDFGAVPGAPGTHRVSWDDRTSHGGRLAAGVYFARLALGSATSTARIVIVH